MAKKKTTKKSASKKVSALDAIVAKYGAGSARKLGAADEHEYETVSTGSIGLDRAIGIGGLPRGRIVEVYGPESSGKTTLTLHAIASAQEQGLTAAFIDAEHALDPSYAAAIGVDTEELVFSQPDYGEQALGMVDAVVRSGDCGVVVVDSVAALTPKAELDGEIEDHHVGVQARMIGKAMRRLASAAAKNNTLVIFINQLRMKIGVRFGSPETTPGGNALKFYSSVRLDVRRISSVKDGDQIVAMQTRVKVVKNKCAQPFQNAEFDIAFGVGIDQGSELLDMAVERGIVTKAGSWYSYGDKKIGQGRKASIEYINAHEGLESALRGKLT